MLVCDFQDGTWVLLSWESMFLLVFHNRCACEYAEIHREAIIFDQIINSSYFLGLLLARCVETNYPHCTCCPMVACIPNTSWMESAL